MWYAIFETATGNLISTGTVIEKKYPARLTVIELGEAFDDSDKDWNPATRTFSIRPTVDPRAHIVEKIDALMADPAISALGLTAARKTALRTLLLGKF